MSGHLLYQPHVHQAGKAFTPDLLLTRAYAVDRAGDALPVPIDRIITGVEVQQVGQDAHGLAAAALVAAGEAGPLLTVASLHAPPDSPGAEFLACAKPISREAWRLADVADHLDQLTLSSWHLADGARTAASEEPLVTEAADDAMRRTAATPGAMTPEAVMLYPARTAGPPAGPSTGFAVQLDDPVLGRQLSLTYTVEMLS